jgi:N-acetylglutamate synthase-like GNAT family acetyltransferase
MKIIKISRAKVIDAQKIRRLEDKVWGEEVVNKYDEPMFVRFDWCFVAKDKQKIVGAIIAYLTRNSEVFVSDWVVDKPYRGGDIGLSLYKKLIKETRGKNIITLIDPKNKPSLVAHKELGFKVVKTIKNAYGLSGGLEGGNRILVRLKN